MNFKLNTIQPISYPNSPQTVFVPDPPKGHKSYFLHFSKYVNKIKQSFPSKYKKQISDCKSFNKI